MKPHQSALSTIVKINAKLLSAVILGILAYFSWPADPKWWGLGVVSIASGLAAIGLIIEAVRAMSFLFTREWVMSEYMAQGDKPKSSDLASDNALKDAGMR